jgi:hypothetical protein
VKSSEREEKNNKKSENEALMKKKKNQIFFDISSINPFKLCNKIPRVKSSVEAAAFWSRIGYCDLSSETVNDFFSYFYKFQC